MGVNSLASPGYGFNDAAVLLTSIVQQATGQQVLTPINLQDFASIGTTALQAGYDPLLNAISVVLGKTIFSIRPYSERFGGLRADALRWGNHVRKLKLADAEFESDQRYYEATSDFWDDGDSADMYTIKKPKPVQLNFYGQNVWQDHVTVYRDQLDVAFHDPDELMQFTSMIMTNMSNRMAQARETCSRAALGNFIAAKNILGAGHVIHLVTEYNSQTGSNLTATTVMQPANYATFIRWLAGYIKTLSRRMEERSNLFQVNITGKVVNQHTPRDRQKLYLLADYVNRMDAEVLSTTYNEQYLGIGDFEEVSFWQSIGSPDELKISPAYMNTSGVIVNGAAQTMSKVFGVLFDEEAVMTQEVNQWNAPTPFNVAGGYTNFYFHKSDRYLNDFSEKGVVLLLDEAGA